MLPGLWLRNLFDNFYRHHSGGRLSHDQRKILLRVSSMRSQQRVAQGKRANVFVQLRDVSCRHSVDVAQAGQMSHRTSSLERLVVAEGLPII